MSQAAALPPRPDAASALDSARRIVVKIGSSLLIDAATRQPTRDWLAAMARDLAGLRGEGREVIVVSSGSIALGRGRLPGLGSRLEDKQAAASVGQSLLMAAWSAALAPHDLVVGQVLLTRDDTERRRRWLNGRATVEALLAHGVIPVVNENDTVATEEIRYGDNDRLAARTAQLARADLLVLLSDVDGLYTADPRRDPTAAHLPLIESLTPDILAMGGGANAQAGAAGTMAAAVLIGATVIGLLNRFAPVDMLAIGPAQSKHLARRIWLFIIAITLHNFPEGAAVGVSFGGGDMNQGLATALGIGIQNMPEGLAVSAAMASLGYGRGAAFLGALASGLVEPVGGLIGASVVGLLPGALPWGLGLAAGAMIYVVTAEIIPETREQSKGDSSMIGLMIGLVGMMFLDIALG
jgi:zinc transporter ZupT